MNVNSETNGRYTEIYIDGVKDGSIAYDERENALVVSGEPRPLNSDPDGVVVKLPEE